MADQKKKHELRVELTEEQRAKIKSETGKDVKFVEFDAAELEERVPPAMLF
jgi:hypothetical protein